MHLKSTVFTLQVLLLVPCFAAFGLPPGSRGKIDFRYPDEIVNPRPACPYEGVFPHPRNCTWYYRCHDHYKIGYYHVNYFECEPGTVFSDGLDQCIHPYTTNYDCRYPITQPPVIITPKPSVECYDSMLRCKVYLCPFGENNVMATIGRQCETAFSDCTDGKQTLLCQESQFFDVLTRTCVPPPSERKCVDQDTFDSTATPPPTTTTTTTTHAPSPVTPSDDCYDSMIECRHYKCPNTQRDQFLCKKAYQTCDYNQLTFYCLPTFYFNYDTRQCVESPLTRGCTQMEEGVPVTTAKPSTTTVVDPSLITFSFTVECSVKNTRPKEPKLAQYYCSNYASCTSGYSTKVELCVKYLQCIHSSNEWKAVVMECPPGLFFSYSVDRCVNKPDDSCSLK